MIKIKEEIKQIKQQIKQQINWLKSEQAAYEPDDSDYCGIQWEINWNYSILEGLRDLVSKIQRRL